MNKPACCLTLEQLHTAESVLVETIIIDNDFLLIESRKVAERKKSLISYLVDRDLIQKRIDKNAELLRVVRKLIDISSKN